MSDKKKFIVLLILLTLSVALFLVATRQAQLNFVDRL